MEIKKYKQFLESKIPTTIELPEDVIKISDAYINAGKEIFVVGGAIRDFILGITPKDWDLVTNALPDESKEILKDFNVSDEQGKSFGVLRVFTEDEPTGYEIASYRRDISGGRDTKGDDQKVEIGGNVTIEDDCNRRDLTMNALFYDIKKKEIVDLVGGIDDIKKNIVRAVGDPSKRFIEDRLRILRVFRFAARIEGEIDDTTAQAIKSDNRLRGVGPKDDVKQERIWEEMKKAFVQAKSYKKYLDFFTEFDMWGEVFPGCKINTKVEDCHKLTSYIANLFKFENTLKLERKMIMDFKIERDVSTKVVFIVDLLKLSPENVFDLYKRKIRCHCTSEQIIDWLDTCGVTDKMFIRFIDYKPTVSSDDLKAKGFKDRELGLEIKRIEIENFKKLIQ